MSKRERWPKLGQLLAMSDDELAQVDPVVMNLVVAKGVPSQANLDIGRYVRLADKWGDDLRCRMPALEAQFHKTPQDWRNDLAFFRLGLVCWYLDIVCKIAYREDQRNVKRIRYTDPSDLFLNGVMDSRRGTCGNMALLHVVLGRRIDLPVSLACVGSHFLCRYEDGKVAHNIESTYTGQQGFSSLTDEEFFAKRDLPRVAQSCGSDLRAVTPREMLGLFLGLRARHLENIYKMIEAEPDYLLARYLFPRNRQLYINQNQTSVQCSMDLFEPDEKGHPVELAGWLLEVVATAPWKRKSPHRKSPQATQKTEKPHDSPLDAFFQEIFVGGDII